MASSLFSLRTSPSCRAGGIHSHLSQALFHYDSSSFSCNIPTYISSSLLLLTEKWTSTAGSSGYSRQSHVLANYPNKGYVVRQKERACQTLWLGTVRYIERPILPRRRRGDFWQLLALGVGFHKLRTALEEVSRTRSHFWKPVSILLEKRKSHRQQDKFSSMSAN